MIKNELQYKVSKKQIKRLEIALEKSLKTNKKIDPEIYEAMICGIQSQIDEIKADIVEYENRKDIA